MKKFLLVIGAVSFLLVGCGTTAGAEREAEFIYKDTYGVTDLKDTKTRVHYIVVRGVECISITPRLNADGSLYIGE